MSSATETRARALLASAAHYTVSLPERRVEIAVLDWGGSGPLMLLHHANGFCKGIWGVVAEGLRDRFRVIAMDARGHGDSSHPDHAGAYSWDEIAEDLVAAAAALARTHGSPIALGIGHSLGGTSMLGAAARRPDLFERLLLVDPVIPIAVGSPGYRKHEPMVQRLINGARRRRAHWPSRAAARTWCQERRFFAAWQPEVIELYLLDGLRERADGGVELKCPGSIEAQIFGGSAGLDVLALAARVHAPTVALWASQGDFSLPRLEQVAATMRSARVEPVASGHLVPMERPDLVAQAARHMLGAR
jgi:pimeloyl-ACP methyl ester carboxylesterase